MFEREIKSNNHPELPKKISSNHLIEIETSSGTFISVLSTDQIYFVHQKMSKSQYSFKLSKKNVGVDIESPTPLTASVIIDSNRQAYAIYPYAIAGKGKNKVKFVQNIDTFEWYAVKKFTYKALNEIEMLKNNNMFVSDLEIEPKFKKTDYYSSLMRGLYQLGLISGRYYVIQKLVDGETLVEVLSTIRRLNLSEKIQTVINILCCVEEVHRKNIIHRDIKGGNLMYDGKKKKWLLVDFEDAIDSSKLPFNGKMYDCPGTDGFDSPETSPEFYKIHGYTLPSYKSDIYSLGIVFKKYIFCDEYELQNSEEGNAIFPILNRMQNNSSMLRPNISDLIITFQSQLEKNSLINSMPHMDKPFNVISPVRIDFTIFNKPIKNNQSSWKNQAIRYGIGALISGFGIYAACKALSKGGVTSSNVVTQVNQYYF